MSGRESDRRLRRIRRSLAEIEKETRAGGAADLQPLLQDMKQTVERLAEPPEAPRASEVVRLARHPKRPTTLDYIGWLFTDFIELHGDRRFADDAALIGGIGFFAGMPVTVIGHQKGRQLKENLRRHFGMAHPEGYRKALRLMEQAERFGRPVITLIDTPGAYPGIGAEERGQAEAIATNLYRMSGLRTPIVAVITGEGGSGGALGLAVADRVFMLGNAIFSVISPEGCASILWRDAGRAAAAAEALKLTARDLYGLGIIDGIVDEPAPGAHETGAETARHLREILAGALGDLLLLPPAELLRKRDGKFRRMGAFTDIR